MEGLKHPEVIGYFPWWRAGDIPSESHNDEARKIFDREHLRAVKRRATLKPEIVQEIAQSMLEVGQQVPILVRPDGDRFVLVEGLHRLEACKALGEDTIYGYLTQAPKH